MFTDHFTQLNHNSRSRTRSIFPSLLTFIAGIVLVFLSLTHTAFAAATLGQTAYIFLNDNGATTNDYTQAHSAATSTAITNVKKGEKLVARIQIDNTGDATSTAQYRLQWENNTDTPDTWNDLGTTTQIRWSLSQKGALPGRYGEAPLTSRQVGTCTTTTTFSSGLFVGGTGTSSSFSLGNNKCTELAYAIETSGATLGKTYRLRLVTGSTTNALDVYTKYPTFSIESGQTIRYSKEARGGYSTTTLDTISAVGEYVSVAIGMDGFPVMAYYAGGSADNLVFAKCNDMACGTWTTTSVDTVGDVGQETSIAIGSDGFAVITYRNVTKSALVLAKCNNLTCTSVATSTVDTGTNVGRYSSVTIGADGIPVSSYYKGTSGVQNLMFARCSNVSCSSISTSTLDTVGDTGKSTSIAIGSDGYPVMSYYDVTGGKANVAKCSDINCSSFSTSTFDTSATPSSPSAIAIGTNGYPVIVYYTFSSGDLRFVQCNNISCSSSSTSTLDTAGDVGFYASLAIGTNGFPIISYYDGDAASLNLKLVTCYNTSCTSYATSSLDTVGDVGITNSIAIGADGYPVIAYYDSTNFNLNFLKCNNTFCTPSTSSSSILTTTNSDLGNYLDDAGYTNVASSDNIYDSISAGTSTRLAYLFAQKNTSNTSDIIVSWEGQVSKATTTSLKIYNNSSATWEVLASNAAPTANTDFTLAATQISNIANYYDVNNVVYVRLETSTTTATTTLRTDQISITFPNITLLHFLWRNDDGNETGASDAAAQDLSLTNRYIGDRYRLRFLIDNQGSGTASNITYRLESASSSCTAWMAVPSSSGFTTEHWKMDLSQYITDASASTNNANLTDPVSKSFVAGEVRVNANQSSAQSLTTSQFTEQEYSIRSTQYVTLDTTYCFRLTNAGAVTNFTYTIQPQVTVEYSIHQTSGGGAVETVVSGTLHTGGVSGGGSGSENNAGGSGHAGGGGGGGGDSG
jgi:hypothetical protein